MVLSGASKQDNVAKPKEGEMVSVEGEERGREGRGGEWSGRGGMVRGGDGTDRWCDVRPLPILRRIRG